MADARFQSLDELVQVMAAVSTRPSLWVGWSMGGMAVLRLAELYPQLLSSALLVATNPCFVTRPDWSSAVEASVFEQFASDLERHQEKTLRRFLALQVRGTEDAMSLLRQLQISLKSQGSASPEALKRGLDILVQTDLRQSLAGIDTPLHWLLGEKDALVPASLAGALKQDYHQKNVVVQEQAGHAPFLSHAEAFVRQLLAVAEPLRQATTAGYAI